MCVYGLFVGFGGWSVCDAVYICLPFGVVCLGLLLLVFMLWLVICLWFWDVYCLFGFCLIVLVLEFVCMVLSLFLIGICCLFIVLIYVCCCVFGVLGVAGCWVFACARWVCCLLVACVLGWLYWLWVSIVVGYCFAAGFVD